MIIYTNGCSHTEDHPDVIQTYAWPSQLMSGLTKSFNYYTELSEPCLNKIKILDTIHFLVNEGKSGVGNDHIFHKTLESVSKLIEIGKKPDYVIVQWSGSNRREHCLLNGESIFVNLYANTEYFLKYEPLGSTHTTHYIYCLQEFLFKHDIKFYFFNYMQFDYCIKELKIFKKIDMNRFIDFGLGSRTLFMGLIDLFKEKKYTRDDQGHANELGNKFISDRIIAKIEQKSII